MGLDEDAAAARYRALKFRVCRKGAPQARWHAVEAGIPDLGVALGVAQAAAAYESAVFTDTPRPLGGFLYWTSRSPNHFNSAVIVQRVFEFDNDRVGAADSRREFLAEIIATFFIAGRGLIVVPSPPPGIVPEGTEFSAELRRPDGTRQETTAQLQAEFNVPGPARLACILPTMKKEEVPVGTELWLLWPAGGAG